MLNTRVYSTFNEFTLNYFGLRIYTLHIFISKKKKTTKNISFSKLGVQ